MFGENFGVARRVRADLIETRRLWGRKHRVGPIAKNLATGNRVANTEDRPDVAGFSTVDKSLGDCRQWRHVAKPVAQFGREKNGLHGVAIYSRSAGRNENVAMPGGTATQS
jgi:hypothetical protein